MEWMVVLGIVTGMRSMTAIAAMCWAAYLLLLPQPGWGHWTSYLFSAIVFTLLALGEYIGDTLPRTPSRKSAGPAAARVVFGALVGALAAARINEPVAGGILAGVVGALIGTWGGWWVRDRLAKRLGHDMPVAIAESVLAVALAVTAVAVLHHNLAAELMHTNY